MPGEAGKIYETSATDGKYTPLRTPQNDVIQIQSDGTCFRVTNQVEMLPPVLEQAEKTASQKQ